MSGINEAIDGAAAFLDSIPYLRFEVLGFARFNNVFQPLLNSKKRSLANRAGLISNWFLNSQNFRENRTALSRSS